MTKMLKNLILLLSVSTLLSPIVESLVVASLQTGLAVCCLAFTNSAFEPGSGGFSSVVF